MGAELERRSAFFAAVLTSSSSCAGRGAGAGAGFAASPSALRVALTTCVASAAFSRKDRPSSGDGAAAAGLARLDGALATVVVLDRAGFVDFEVAPVLFVASTAAASSLGRSKVLSRAEVAGEQVATDETALRTASAWATGVSMEDEREVKVRKAKKVCNGLIPNHIIAAKWASSKRQQYPEMMSAGVRCWRIGG